MTTKPRSSAVSDSHATADFSLLPTTGSAADSISGSARDFDDLMKKLAAERLLKPGSSKTKDSENKMPQSRVCGNAATSSDTENTDATASTSDIKGKDEEDNADTNAGASPAKKAGVADDPALSAVIMALLAPPAADKVLVKKASIPQPLANAKIAVADGSDSAADSADAPVATPTTAEKSGVLTEKPPAASTAKRIPAGLKPVTPRSTTISAIKTADAPPADISPSAPADVEAKAEQTGAAAQQLVAELLHTTPNGQISGQSADGTAAALSKQRMKFEAEKNEIAGSAVQKVPGVTAFGDAASGLAQKSLISPDSNLPGNEGQSLDPSVMSDLAGKSVPIAFESTLPATVPVIEHSAALVERVAHLVNQEVVMIRQSGANTLAVSLKLDPHTELFLQLTHHDGQVQASIRCERGSVAGLDSHWADLQDSLAKQNVQLLPLEGKPIARAPMAETPVSSQSNSNFNQTSQDSRRQTREISLDLSAANNVKIIPSPKTQNQTNSPNGWESWA